MYRLRYIRSVSGRIARCALLASFALALLLRIAIPLGYMPTASDDGWYLKFCPDGMPAAAMVALFGDTHQHHHVGHHSSHNTAQHADVQNDEHAGFAQCDLGGGLALDLVANADAIGTRVIQALPTWHGADTWLPAADAWQRFRSRAPPSPV